jgi:hypothetical protein
MGNNRKIRKTIRWKDLEIHLFEPVELIKIEKESISNIIAYNTNGNIVWEAEPPKSKHDTYFEIEIDTVKNVLVAGTSWGLRHIINLETGKVIEYYLVK